MFDLVQRVKLAFTNGDPRVNDWLLMQSPLSCALILLAYFTVLWVRPKMMKILRPFDLKQVLVIYNTALVLLSSYTFYEFLVSSWTSSYSYTCEPVNYSSDPLAVRSACQMARACWWYFFSKIVELLDTVFFILRKKDKQLSFLHVYHHSTMVLIWWSGTKYVAGGQSFFIAMCNSFVHVLMYTYYALSAFGPHMQKYLTWKKYLTQIQLIQFFLFLVHTGTNLCVDCAFSRGFTWAAFLYTVSLIILFGSFYIRAYRGRRDRMKENSD